MIWLFLLLSLVSIGSGLAVIFFRNPVYSVLSLIVCFFSIAAHFLLLQSEFLAAIQVIVYAGAIMVLFLFIIMLMNLSRTSEPKKPFGFVILSVFASIILFTSLALSLTTVFKPSSFCPMLSKSVLSTSNLSENTISKLGQVLFNEYLFPFEFSALLFLAALVGVVVLSKKSKEPQ